MSDLMSVLADGDPGLEARASELSDRQVTTLYEALVVTAILDESLGHLQSDGRLPFHLPSGAAAAVSAGTGLAIDDADWLYPSFRDAAAFLIRGGSLEQLVAQALASADDELHGRQLPGHLSLANGRFVTVSGTVGTRAAQSAGTALSMQLREAATASVLICGSGDIEHGGLYEAMALMATLRLPAVIVCRNSGPVDVADRAAGFGIGGRRVDGGDVLAVYKAVRSARGHAATGKGARVVDAVLPSEPEDAAARLRPLLESRGIWDPGQDEELRQRMRARVAQALEEAESAGPPSPSHMVDDVQAECSWMLQEQGRDLPCRDG